MNEAIQSYIKTIQRICPNIDMDALSFLEKGLSVTTLSKKKYYIQANSTQKNVGFVFSGLLRAFYIDDNGNEITIRFASENTFATDYVAFITQTPSKYYFQTIEPSVIVNIPYLFMQEAFLQFPSLERYGRLIAEEHLKEHQKRIQTFLFEKPEQRYLNFINEKPDLFNRVSLSYLSTYLGIERPSLSRIRKKLAGQ